ncbi:hypothetical protein RHMOL_Rhmol08G0203400 [Rhododendron molle]|uniref:Uncharacterized protein n=1 Tax=Rhododendron molle TaxID=49168 RepID=A0ACC0MRT7_RHOML|nr:hypothetical protein RHMOL_Rhmol08G0203400 [Rhododendron molle]
MFNIFLFRACGDIMANLLAPSITPSYFFLFLFQFAIALSWDALWLSKSEDNGLHRLVYPLKFPRPTFVILPHFVLLHHVGILYDTNVNVNRETEFYTNPCGEIHLVCDDKVCPKIQNACNYMYSSHYPKTRCKFCLLYLRDA